MDHFENYPMNENCIELSPTRTPSIAYIPSSSDEDESHFHDYVEGFKRHGITQFYYTPIDPPSPRTLDENIKRAFQQDIIYFSGGNTYELMRNIQLTHLEEHVRSFLDEGGVVSGCSAGAIVMTPRIMTAGFPAFDCDDNEVGLKNLKGMDLVNFEFFPHYEDRPGYRNALRNYSKICPNPLYACEDGSGIIVDDLRVSFYGNSYVFMGGKCCLI